LNTKVIVKNISNQTVDRLHWLPYYYYYYFSYYGSQKGPIIHTLQNIFFCVQQKKYIKVLNNLRVS